MKFLIDFEALKKIHCYVTPLPRYESDADEITGIEITLREGMDNDKFLAVIKAINECLQLDIDVDF